MGHPYHIAVRCTCMFIIVIIIKHCRPEFYYECDWNSARISTLKTIFGHLKGVGSHKNTKGMYIETFFFPVPSLHLLVTYALQM